MSATAVIAAGGVTKPNKNKENKKQEDLDENAADDEDEGIDNIYDEEKSESVDDVDKDDV